MSQIHDLASGRLAASTFLALAIAHGSATAQYQAFVDEATKISFNIPKQENTDRCNIQISTQGSQPIEQVVEGPNFSAAIELTPNQAGDISINWIGKTRFRGLRSVVGCVGQGQIIVSVVPSAPQIEAAWTKVFSEMTAERRECVEIGLTRFSIKWQVSNPTERIVGPYHQSVMPIYQRCDRFDRADRAWKQWQSLPGASGSQFNYPCVIEGKSTRCDGFYAERMPSGELNEISRTAAITNHMAGRSWTTGQRENSEARVVRETAEAKAEAMRIRAEIEKQRIENEAKRFREEEEARLREKKEKDEREAALAKQKADEEARIARLAAEEKERNWLRSDEYKAQQAQIDKRAAEERERKEREQKYWEDHFGRVEQERKRREAGGISPPSSGATETVVDDTRSPKYVEAKTAEQKVEDAVQKLAEDLKEELDKLNVVKSGWKFQRLKDDFTEKSSTIGFVYEDGYFCAPMISRCSEPNSIFAIECVKEKKRYLPVFTFRRSVTSSASLSYRFDNADPVRANSAFLTVDRKEFKLWNESEFIRNMIWAKTLRFQIIDRITGERRVVNFKIDGLGAAIKDLDSRDPCN